MEIIHAKSAFSSVAQTLSLQDFESNGKYCGYAFFPMKTGFLSPESNEKRN